jgi:putrescine importer
MGVDVGAGLRRSLSLGSLLIHGLAFMVPLTIFTTYGIVAARTRGAVSATYLAAAAGMALVAQGYATMSRASPAAGSAYSYALEAFGPRVGFLSGWTLLLGYAFLPALNALVSSIFLGSAFPGLPPRAWILGHMVLACLVNLLGIRLADRVDRAIVLMQLAFLAVFACALVGAIVGEKGAAGLLDARAFFDPGKFEGPGEGAAALLSGASILALSFLGFDAISTLSEEALRPRVDVPRATLLACAGAGLLFTLLSFLMQAAWPTAWLEMKSPDGGSYELIVRVGGAMLGYAFIAAYSIGCLASSISAIASAARVLYGMGRDGSLPGRVFARLSGKRRTPALNILILGLLGLSALGVSLTTAASLLNFGALFAFSIVCASVVARFYVRERRRKGIDLLRYLIAPTLGAMVCLAIWIKLDGLAMRLGLAWTALGFVYLAFATKFFRKALLGRRS